jgi:ABC-type Fe3+-hydroxamate transport system substrate-binding protein
LKIEGHRIAAYGAPAKGNTLLNYCGIGTELIDFTVDRAPSKQGKFLPGSHIPVFAPEAIANKKPDYVLLLPWNLQREIVDQLSFIREWGGRFIVPIPHPKIIEA